MSEVRVWGVAGSGALMVSGALVEDSAVAQDDAKIVSYPSFEDNGTDIAIYDNWTGELPRKILSQPYGDFRKEDAVIIDASPTMKIVNEYLLAQKGL